MTTIYLQNFPLASTEQELTELFSQFGQVANVVVVADGTQGDPSAFGFVTMATHEGAEAAVQALDGKVNGSTAFSVSPAWPKKRRPGPRKGGRSPIHRVSTLF